MRSILSKKSQLQTLAPSIIALVLAATLLIVGLIMIQEMRDTDVVSKANTATVTNQALGTVVSGTDEVLSTASACSATSVALTNATSGAAISSGNYTYTACTVTPTPDTVWNNTAWNATYTYTYGDETYDSATATVTGMGAFADFWQIIVLAIVISIVIGLLLVLFAEPGKNRR